MRVVAITKSVKKFLTQELSVHKNKIKKLYQVHHP